MQAPLPPSASYAAYSGGHGSDSIAHPSIPDGAAAAASEIFRDFTLYSAMLLSHLFALEHAQLQRDAATAAETRRCNLSVQSPQLLMRAALAEAKESASTKAAAGTTSAGTPTSPLAGTPCELPLGRAYSEELGSGNRQKEEKSSPVSMKPSSNENNDLTNHTMTTSPSTDAAAGEHSEDRIAATSVPLLPHLATRHRPHILFGFLTQLTGGSAPVVSTAELASLAEDPILSDTATRWTPGSAQGGFPDSTRPPPPPAPPMSAGAVAASSDETSTLLLAAFDAFYFPTELFSSSSKAAGIAATASISREGWTREDSGSDLDWHHTDLTEPNNNYASSITAAAGGNAPPVTELALRDAFHTLLLLGQRCAVIALSLHGITGAASEEGDGRGITRYGNSNTAPAHPSSAAAMYLSSEDEQRRSGRYGRYGRVTDGDLEEEEENGEAQALRQIASASLQFMLQLACSCPCTPLAHAAQLCLSHALAVQPPPRGTAGWVARQQLLRFLPTVQPSSRVPVADGGGAGTALGHPPMSPTGYAMPGGSSSNSNNGRIPATQYIRGEDPLLWFDGEGHVHVCTAQQWWTAHPGSPITTGHSPLPPSSSLSAHRSRGAAAAVPVLAAFCGPMPATTALPTVQRLLMEEEQFAGPGGSAAAVLLATLEAVAAEVTRSARTLPGTSGAGLVYGGSRRRRGLHSPSSSAGSSMSYSTTSLHSASANASHNASAPQQQLLSVNTRIGALPLPAASSSLIGSPVTKLALTTTNTTRLSKAATRRRALLFALAQSHLLPPITQLITAKTLLYTVFTDSGECPTYYRLLSLYPDVLRAHHSAMHYVLFEDGPLPVDIRLMIATMAASRHRCEYLVSRFSALLLRYADEAMLEEEEESEEEGDGNWGGDAEDTAYGYSGVASQAARRTREASRYGGPGVHEGHRRSNLPDRLEEEEAYRRRSRGGGGASCRQVAGMPGRGQARLRWITHGPPRRLRAAQRFIALAVHTPWTLSDTDLRTVMAAGWTIPEVLQLIAIIAQVVPLCSFVMGVFVPAEPWTMTLLPLPVVEGLGHRAVTEDAGSGVSGSSCTDGVGTGTTTGNAGISVGGGNASLSGSPGLRRSGGAGVSVDHTHVSCVSPTSPFPSSNSPAHSSGGNGNGNAGMDVYRRYAGQDNVVSEQRIKSGTSALNPHTLWRSQFTWQELGATSMEQYYPGAATLMSEEMEGFFDIARQLTKADCVGLMNPGFEPAYAFRSLQLYVQNLLGFMVEDYPYNDINKVLRRPAKWFAQVLTMRPETVTRSEVVRWYVPSTPPTGKSSDLSAESSLVTHQLKREIELLSVVDCAQGGHRGGIEAASAHPDVMDGAAPTAAEAARDRAESAALQTALTLQDERVLLLIALATMEARREGLLHILMRPVCAVLSNM